MAGALYRWKAVMIRLREKEELGTGWSEGVLSRLKGNPCNLSLCRNISMEGAAVSIRVLCICSP